MTRTIDEYLKDHPRVQRFSPDLRPIAQEAVRLEALTNDESWDWFTRFLEAAIKAEKLNGEHFVAKLRAPFTPESEMQTLKAAVILSDCRRTTLEEVLMLPKQLKTQAEKARTMIANMERDAA